MIRRAPRLLNSELLRGWLSFLWLTHCQRLAPRCFCGISRHISINNVGGQLLIRGAALSIDLTARPQDIVVAIGQT
ncbi:hypothetical protein T440DRAFT_171756 [Plenodomus tracheiphilus IPT5]|uniref:Secreted protein n=1 Tax=Plenodomus tracheiphilus IPT5 TaxID=1408161 RepID=A0A6A7B266_9PLEO|nr:hypothetical protein T440DRAFT_171756 [Plenodomus tracheiphilus IPT5]